MEVGFEFDPNEKVWLGSRPMTLSRAVREYREMQVAAIATSAPVWRRENQDADPRLFQPHHMEELAQLPEFAEH
jgi:hypothetical protein